MNNEEVLRCPKCNDEITYLNFDVTGTCGSQLYRGESADYDLSDLTYSAEFDNFSCPECNKVLFFTEGKAKEFLE